jgi:hypothetical protein
MTIRKFRAGRVANADASSWVGEPGTIFYDETTGQLKVADGTTPGGHFINLVLASTTQAGAIKLGPGVILNSEGQVIIDSTGLDFSFGDFQATTPANGAATLSSANANQDIDIVSNGTGVINMVGDFHIHRTAGYNPSQPDTDGAVFAVKADGQIQMKVPLSDSTTGALEIIGNDSGLFLAPNQTGVILHVTGNSGLVSRNYFDANANYVLIGGRRYNGTQSNPTRVLNGEIMLRVVAQGAAATGSGPAAFRTFGPARIEFVATEDQTPTAQGGEVRILATANGSAASATDTLVATFNATTGVTATKFNGNITGNVLTASQPNITSVGTLTSLAVTGNITAGNVVVGTTTYSNLAISTTALAADFTIGLIGSTGNLVINRTTAMKKDAYVTGNIYVGAGSRITTPKVIINDGGIRTVSGGTAVTIDFNTDSIVLWTSPSGTGTVTLSNYTPGATARLIIDIGATSRDINYGVAAGNNSSDGATSFNGSGGGSVNISNAALHLDYTCITAVASGCYVKVTVL